MTTLPQPVAPYTHPATDTTAAADSIRHLSPGVYLAADLYRHYASLCREAGTTPASRQAYGKQLRALGLHPRHDNTGTRRCWAVP